MVAQYVDAWKISSKQLQLPDIITPEESSTVDIYAYLINERNYDTGYKTFIRSDIVDWLEENTKSWILNLCGNEVILKANDAWDFIEWLVEQE